MRRWFHRFFLLVFVPGCFACNSQAEKGKTAETGNTQQQAVSSDPSLLSLRELDQLLSEVQNDPEIYYFRAIRHTENQDYTSAVKDLTEALRLDETFVSAWHDRGVCKFMLDDFRGAIEDYSIAIAGDSVNPVYFYDRGWAWSKLRETEHAIADFDEALRMDPGFGKAYFRRGKEKISAGKNGCTDLQKAVELQVPEATEVLKNSCP